MMRSLPLRYLVPVLIFLVGTGTVSVTTVMSWKAKRDQLLADMTRHVGILGMTLSGQLESEMLERDTGGIDTAIESLQGDPDLVKAAVIGPDHHILAATRISATGQRLGRYGYREILESAKGNGAPGRASFLQTADNHLQAVFTLDLRSTDRALLPDSRGYLLMEYDMDRLAGINQRGLVRDAAYRATAIAVLSFLLWFFLDQRLLRRVQKLARFARRIGEGDFSGRLQDPSRDELGELARDFESMARRLERNTRELTYQALHDNLTGMLNRWGFERQLQTVLRRLPHDTRDYTLVFMDLDQFRVVNETWGHSAGDDFLRELAKLLHDRLFVRDHLARLGGDEFAILLEDCPEPLVSVKAEELRQAVEAFRYPWQGHTLRTTCSLGVVLIRRGTEDMERLFTQADAACFAAKHGGRNRVQIWLEGDEELTRVHGEMRWVNRIRTALEEDRFRLYAQPIVPVTDDGENVLRYEILTRLLDENGDLVPPGEFLAAAEHYHLAAGIDRWVIRNTIRELAARPAHLQRLDMCTINLSGLSLNDPGLADFVSSILERTDPLLSGHICFEITETAAITHLGQASAFIRDIQALGCRFALDDFGSGVSSFGYLKNLPVDYIKIDGMFVRDILDDPVDHALVRAVNEVVHKMGKQTIAEFVESAAIRGALAEIGVDLAQGFGIGRPVPLDELIGPPEHTSR